MAPVALQAYARASVPAQGFRAKSLQVARWEVSWVSWVSRIDRSVNS